MSTETPLDPQHFRRVMGHYPTGVVLATALDQQGDPIGMVVGSFTSVSLDPPLVAYLPTKSSGTYARMRHATHLVFNVLSADQTDLCRRFASRAVTDKWTGVAWHPSANGLPILDEAVAWIEGEVQQVIDAGDHDLVFLRVQDLAAPNDTLPLVFFQGGYGRFSPRSLVMPPGQDMFAQLRLAERARPVLESLGEETNLESGLLGQIGSDLVLLASAAPLDAEVLPQSLGNRLPFIPPSGSVFVAWAGEAAADHWLSLAPTPLDDALRAHLRQNLERVRERGYSIVLESSQHAAIDRDSAALSADRLTPAGHRRLQTAIAALADSYEPETLPADARVRVLTVPVRDSAGRVVIGLQLRNLPAGLTQAAIDTLAQRMQTLALRVSETCMGAD
ncbi:monooxygenase/oxidoreductase [Ketogulonicigenium robustum]|uniref:Monooxygenase/oxidoreductase n=1 Tax=Ketogulonicigenium robustum TaxID=92947 RepID=A0A1W6P2C9_9RHOB|nr:flavin reductase [Ketogulonicigenium robustum]ARO15490.1 monooxygenase/oxidoreductase [Ketogulonicigenium robustum]